MAHSGKEYLIDHDGHVYRPLLGGQRWQRTGDKDSEALSRLEILIMQADQKNLFVNPAASNDAGSALYYDPLYDPRPVQDQLRPILARDQEISKRNGCASPGCLAFIILAILVIVIVVVIKLTTGSTAPSDVMASPLSKYKIKVTWTNDLKDASGFHLDNGCPVGACGGHGATRAKTVGRVTSTIFRVTPGAYECFRVQAFSKTTTTGWSSYGCTSTPNLNVYATHAWTPTRVILKAGDRLTIKAIGQLSVGSSSLVFPSGKHSCTPAQNHASNASNYPAPGLPCLSLIGRIGNHRPFEVGDSVSVITPHGRLYLGVNGSDFTGSSGSWTVTINIGGTPPSP